ncbi:MAG: SDR family oxidoreductase [Syntrophomonadaceae bacterium]|nr:SDR family oxidoreductase [Syntrophomonadaceae bacterium]MDD3022815.1 SDR family oxidoreductase [Syntrophomonadaceae bacterium]
MWHLRSRKLGASKAAAFKADVAKVEDAEATVEFAKKTYGGLHLAFNNAGIVGAEKYVGELTPEEWQSVININLNTVFYAMHFQIPAILASGGSAIVPKSPNHYSKVEGDNEIMGLITVLPYNKL